MNQIYGLRYKTRPARGEPTGALVLLHGRGADESDLLGLIDGLDPERQWVGITPRGPLSLEPPGPLGSGLSSGAHWYRSAKLGYPDPETFEQGYARLDSWLRSLPAATGVAWEKTVLGGFSQGAVMAYGAGLGAGRPSPAGILALSGFIPSVPGFELDLETRRGLPVAVGHGSVDPVIPVQFARRAVDRLRAAELAVTYRESAMGHAVDPDFVVSLRAWLAGLAPKAATQVS